MKLFLKTPRHERIELGSRVRIKRRDNIFRKTNPVFSSIWSDEVYTIFKIDKKVFPAVYYVDGLGTTKGFYSFQLLLVSDADPILPTTLPNKIKVLGITHHNSLLRNQKILPSKHDISYIIIKDNERESVNASDLLLFKKLYGNDVLTYSDFFLKPENVSYVI